MFKKITLEILFLSLLTFTSIAKADVEDTFKYRFSISKSQQLVYDHFTNKIWQRCANGEMYYDNMCIIKSNSLEGSDIQNGVNQTIRKDNLPWRLPTSREIASIILCKTGINKAYYNASTTIPLTQPRSDFIPSVCNSNGSSSYIFPIHSTNSDQYRDYFTSESVSSSNSMSGTTWYRRTIGIPAGNFNKDNSGKLKLVFDAPEAILKNEFPNIDIYMANGRTKLISTNWAWKPSINQQYSLPIQKISQKNLINLIALKLQEEIVSKSNLLPRAPQEPVKEANSYSPINNG